MILSNVNIGTGPSAGDGDPLRTAFNTINSNFAKIQSNVNALTNSVSSVAGRTGNITLTTQDIVGINNYATVSYVSSQLANVGAANVLALEANVAALQSDVNTLYGNAGIQSSTLATLTANAAAQAGSLATLTANAASQAGELTTLLSNAASQAGEIASLLSNAGSQHEAISSLQSNAAVQAGLITALQANVGISNYSNSNVASYLTTYSGNIAVGNVIFPDLSVQTTAYTGTQWRSNLQSNVQVKPTWLSYVPGGKNQEGTQYGFDATGMFFAGNSDGDFAYPIQTNLHFHEQDVLEVVATIYFGATNNDHGLCIFSTNERPIWQSSANGTRIAFQYTAGIPVLYGQTTANTAPGSPVLSVGNYYTIKFKYDPGNTVIVETFSGNTATGSPIDTRSLAEVMPAGDYKLGFDADNDTAGVKSYWTNLVVRTLTNTVVNDLEVQGQVIGNLVPQSNVTQSLGNVTHQWKELWVSGNTIHLGGATLSVAGGAIQSSIPIAANVTATNITVQGTRIEFASGGYIEETEVLDGNASPLGYYGIALNSSDDGIISMNALDSNASATSSLIVSNVAVQINVANVDPSGSPLSWVFNQSGEVLWPDGTTQTTGGSPFNQDLNTTDNVTFANIATTTGQISLPTDTDFALRLNHSTFGEANVIVNSQGYMSITGGYTGRSFTQILPGEVGATGYFGFTGNITNISGINGLILDTGLEGSGGTWTFNTNGGLTIPSDIHGAGTDALVIQNTSTGVAYLELPVNPGTNSVYLANQDPAGNVVIRTGDFGSENDWAFNANGDLTVPNYVKFKGNTYIGDEPGFGNPAFRIVAPLGYGATIETDSDITGNSWTWTFGVDGTLGAPGTITAVGVETDTVTIGIGGNITFPDSTVQTTAWTGNITGNITVGNSAVNFIANSSGDGNGYSTIELVPDVDLLNSDQYLIVDPTAPGHIHIRAGGAQDGSSADLIFGGENSHVKIPAGANTSPYIKSNGYEWQFGTDGILTLAAGGSIYAPVNDPIDIRVQDSGNVGYAIEQSVRDGTDTLQTLTSLDRQEFKIYTDFQDTNNVWTFAKSGQFSLAGNLRFPDSTVQTTAWTGTVAYGNTIAIGYQTGNSSQGNNAVAIGSTAGQTSQGAKAIGIGEVAGRLNQGIESIGLGAGAGEQNQGAYAIAIGSTTAYLNQGVGAVAIGTSAGALYQGEHAIAIGTGAGNGLQGNNSIILNATGSTLDQTTDDTFTVKPIRSASAGNVLYYNPTSGEITYSNISNQTLNTTDTVRFAELAVGISGSLETIIYNDAININGSFALTESSIETFTGNISGNVSGYAIGYRDVPQVSAGNVTLGLTDAGKHYYSTASAPTTLTIPSNANVAFPIGTAITVVNSGTGNITISKQTEANLYLAGNSTSATRTLTSYGMATLLKTATNQWFINGTGLV